MSTSTEDCETTMICNSKSSSDDELISIEFPFYLKHPHHQDESCGYPGFGLFCDDKLGLLLALPNAENLTVDNIYYYDREIVLSDPNECLPQKLLSLNLTMTPFEEYEYEQNEEYWVYNCSGNSEDYGFSYDEIDCMKGSNYSILSVRAGTTVTNSKCTLLKNVFLPMEYVISNYSSLPLYWYEEHCEYCEEESVNIKDRTRVAIAMLVVVVTLVLISFVVWCLHNLCRANDEQPASAPTTDIDHVVAALTHSSPPSSGAQGLDQITIDMYPTMVIGKSGRLIKPDDYNCPICLSDYKIGDTLRILPECLHRFHVDCIDLWLNAEVTCPICRISPSHHS